MRNIFPYVFSNVFTTVINNTELIDNIIDSVLNSEGMKGIISELENMTNAEITFNEYSTAYVIDGKLPGVEKKDLAIDYENNYITIKVVGNQIYSNGNNLTVAVINQNGDIEKDYYVKEANPSKIRAFFKNGNLKVIIPKKKPMENKNTIIDVKSYKNY